MAYVDVRSSSAFCVTFLLCAEVVGRLDHLVEAVYERFKDRYYPDESMYLHFRCSQSQLTIHQECSSTFKATSASHDLPSQL